MDYAYGNPQDNPHRASSEPGPLHAVFNGIPEDSHPKDNYNGDDDSTQPLVIPRRKRTQKDQDAADDQARKQAMKDLIQSWLAKLQLISVITTFFAGITSSMLQVTAPGGPGDDYPVILQVANASFLGATVLHSWAAIVSFLAAFVLVRYKLKEATKEEHKAEASGKGGMVSNGPMSHSPDTEKNTDAHNKSRRITSEPAVHSCDPRLEQYGPFNRQPPIHLLERCHTICMTSATVGFVLGLLAFVAYSWNSQGTAVGAFTSTIMALCLTGTLLSILPFAFYTK